MQQKLTPQEVVNKVVAGLASQGFEKSINPSTGACLYRDGQGRKCGAGHLIADEYYTREIEGWPSWHKFVVEVLQASGVDTERDGPLVHQLQASHDTASTPQEMKSILMECITEARLELPLELQS